MEVSTILEAYTIGYGWTVYRLFFLIFLSIGAILYPVVILVFDLLNSYLERGGDPIQLAKAGMYKIAIIFIVIVTGLLPTVPLDMSIAQIRTPCGLEEMTQNAEAGEYQFQFEQSRVPIVPWIAMQLASGVRAVVNIQLPCVDDLTAASHALHNLNISEADDPVKLNAEQQRFSSECFIPSVQHYQRTIRGAYGQQAAERMRLLTRGYIEENSTTKELLLALPSSTFLRDNFYQKPGYCTALAEGAVMFDYCLGLPFKALGPVDQIVGTETSLLSEYQRTIGETIPTCNEWFETPDIGLRDQLYDAAENHFTSIGSYATSNIKWADSGIPGGGVAGFGADVGASIIQFTSDIIGGGSGAYKDFIVDRIYLNAGQSGAGLLSASNRSLANNLMTAGGAGAVLGIVGFDVAETIASDAVSFYTGAIMYRIVASLFLPMLIMGVFMFWAFYMIISEFKGAALIQGAIFIFVLSIIPAIWVIGNHLDDRLYVAMFPQSASLADILKSPADHIERLILEIVSTVYYIILPLILLYVTMMAGANRHSTSVYGAGGHKSAESGSGSFGGKSGSITSRLSKNARGRVSGLKRGGKQ